MNNSLAMQSQRLELRRQFFKSLLQVLHQRRLKRLSGLTNWPRRPYRTLL